MTATQPTSHPTWARPGAAGGRPGRGEDSIDR